jgi:hypothetical protein
MATITGTIHRLPSLLVTQPVKRMDDNTYRNLFRRHSVIYMSARACALSSKEATIIGFGFGFRPTKLRSWFDDTVIH